MNICVSSVLALSFAVIVRSLSASRRTSKSTHVYTHVDLHHIFRVCVCCPCVVFVHVYQTAAVRSICLSSAEETDQK